MGDLSAAAPEDPSSSASEAAADDSSVMVWGISVFVVESCWYSWIRLCGRDESRSRSMYMYCDIRKLFRS